MANRREVDNVYTGFCKVFGKVDHTILLSKIEFNGIRGNLLRWFAFYIINRSQRVVFKVLLLKKKDVCSGVPQSSILGLLLFILFNIGFCFKNTRFLLHTDDLKVSRCINDILHCEKLQQDLHRLSDYCYHNRLRLSLSKFKTISFTKKQKYFTGHLLSLQYSVRIYRPNKGSRRVFRYQIPLQYSFWLYCE